MNAKTSLPGTMASPEDPWPKPSPRRRFAQWSDEVPAWQQGRIVVPEQGEAPSGRTLWAPGADDRLAASRRRNEPHSFTWPRAAHRLLRPDRVGYACTGAPLRDRRAAVTRTENPRSHGEGCASHTPGVEGRNGCLCRQMPAMAHVLLNKIRTIAALNDQCLRMDNTCA